MMNGYVVARKDETGSVMLLKRARREPWDSEYIPVPDQARPKVFKTLQDAIERAEIEYDKDVLRHIPQRRGIVFVVRKWENGGLSAPMIQIG